MMARLTSGWPKEAEEAARRRAQAIAISQPPPGARPLIGAMGIAGERSHERNRAGARSSRSLPPASSIFVNALMSAPAQKRAGFGEATMTALALPSASA